MEEKDRNEEIEEKKERRAHRRRRRVRNQIIAYIAAVLLLAGIVAAANFGVQQFLIYARAWQENREVTANPDPEPEESPDVFVADDDPLVDDPVPTDDDPPPDDVPSDPPIIPSALDIFVEDRIAELSLEDKLAALFVITPEALTDTAPVVRAGDTTRERLEKYPVGGLAYFAANISSATQISEMLENTKEMSKYPIFLAVDEEGGSVARLARANLAQNVGPMADIGESGDPAAAQAAGLTIGTYLGEYGFNLNFAPVADVLADDESSIMGDRSFGSDAALVGQMVAAFVAGQKEAGVFSTLKHFPGMGSVEADSHSGMAVSERTLDDLRATDLGPFIAGIEAGAELVMVGHISLPAIIGDNTPASLSGQIISDLLRDELGFAGIVITDALDMGAITEYYAPDEAAIAAIDAGADMLLMPENFAEAYEGLLAAVNNGQISVERIDESLRRIYRIKYAERVE